MLGDRSRPGDRSTLWSSASCSACNSATITRSNCCARALAKLGAEKAGWIFPDLTIGAPITTEPESHSDHAALDPNDALARWAPFAHGASNEWAIAGSRTATGKPILANDPHLDLSAPILWYLARTVTPEGSVKGVTIPGTPAVLLGQNDHIAWGFTTACTQTQQTLCRDARSHRPDQISDARRPAPFEIREETIPVKGGADVKLTVRSTRHGPVLSDVDEALRNAAGPGKVMALAFTGLGDKDTTYDAIFRLNVAKNWDEFLAALRLFQTPTQNIAYADIDGNIGYKSPGLVPLRKTGDGLTPVDGASADVRLDGLRRLRADRRRATIPPAGFLFNANNAHRVRRSERRSGATGRSRTARAASSSCSTRSKSIRLDTSAAMQADHLSLAARD